MGVACCSTSLPHNSALYKDKRIHEHAMKWFWPKFTWSCKDWHSEKVHKARSVISLVTFLTKYLDVSPTSPLTPMYTHIHCQTHMWRLTESQQSTRSPGLATNPLTFSSKPAVSATLKNKIINALLTNRYCYINTHIQYSRFLHNSRRARSSGVAARFLGSAIFFPKLIINCGRGLYRAHAQSS